MNLLPIVVRELRVRSRRTADYRLRLGAGAIVGLIVFGIVQSANRNPNGIFSAWRAFTWLAGMLFIFCLFEGARNTADSLSSEKREGTLGLLFLTDLKGVDIVLGKAAATGLNSLYSLLAAIPFLGVLLLVGGIAGGEFARVGLALINMLFFAVSAGLLASSATQRENQAMVFAAALVAGIVVLTPLIGMLVNLWIARSEPSLPMAFSPGCAGALAFEPLYAKHPRWFWISLGLSHALGWCGIALASRAVRRLGAAKEVAAAEKPGSSPTRSFSAARRKTAIVCEDDPIQARALMQCSSRKWIWTTAMVALALTNAWLILPILTSTLTIPPSALYQVMSITNVSVCVLFWLVVAHSGARFLAEGKREGTLELLATTPAAGRTLLVGARRAVTRIYRGPMYLFILIKLLALAFLVGQELQYWGHPSIQWHFEWRDSWRYILPISTTILTFFSVTRVAMWFGLRSGNPVKSAAKAMGIVFLAPIAALQLAPSIVGPSAYWVWTFTPFLLIAKDTVFLVWANWRLKGRFNEAMAA